MQKIIAFFNNSAKIKIAEMHNFHQKKGEKLMKKRLLSALIVFCLSLGAIPIKVLATESPGILKLDGIGVGNYPIYQADEEGRSIGKKWDNAVDCENYTVNVQGSEASLQVVANNFYLRWSVADQPTDGSSSMNYLVTSIKEAHGDKFCIQVADNEAFDNAKSYYLWVKWNASDENPDEQPDTTSSAYRAALSASADQLTVDEDFFISINVSSKTATTYNAFHYELRYDPAILTYAAVDGEARVEDSGGKLTVIGYGADKICGGEAITLQFIARAEGTTDVELLAAKVDKSANAPLQDAPEATIAVKKISVRVAGFSVDLPDGFTGTPTVSKGENYTFTADDLCYDHRVSATMGGESVAVTDNGDGSYTIANVTGNLIITATRIPRSFAVTLISTGLPLADGEVEYVSTATYLVDHTFTIHKDEKSVYLYTVTATVNGAPVDLVNNGDGTYTLAGGKITGPVVLTVNKALNTTENAQLTFVGSGAGDVVLDGYAASGDVFQVTPGKNISFTLNLSRNYTYTVRVGDTILSAVEGVYTIPGELFRMGEAVQLMVDKVLALQDVGAEVYFSTAGGAPVYRVTAAVYTVGGQTLYYDGQAMYLLGAEGELSRYAYLVVSDTEVTAESAQALITLAEGTAGTISPAGTKAWDINSTGVVDINDAQLVYDMYNRAYAFAADRMSRFLRADVNGDGAVNVQDCAAIVNGILNGEAVL